MSWTERVTVTAFLAQNPAVFWIAIHIAWGAIYGVIGLLAILMPVAGAVYRKKNPSKKWHLFAVLMIFSSGQLAAVFAIPWLIGALDKNILINGEYVTYFLSSWGITSFVLWFVLRNLINFRDVWLIGMKDEQQQA